MGSGRKSTLQYSYNGSARNQIRYYKYSTLCSFAVVMEWLLFLRIRNSYWVRDATNTCLSASCRRVPCVSLGAHHKGLGMLWFASCLTSFVAASTSEPGYIVDNETVAKHENYAQHHGVCHTRYGT